jgi:hypothetical protein
MGRASRRKRERKRAPDHVREFKQALLKEHLDAFIKRDEGCLLCNSKPTPILGVWHLGKEFAARIGVPKGKYRQYWYRLCRSCGASVGPGKTVMNTLIEAAIIAQARGQNVVYFDSSGMPIVDPGDEPLPAGTAI